MLLIFCNIKNPKPVKIAVCEGADYPLAIIKIEVGTALAKRGQKFSLAPLIGDEANPIHTMLPLHWVGKPDMHAIAKLLH